MNTKIIKQAGMSVLALGVVFALGACASKPSPWSQQASPWDSREVTQEEVPMDEMAADQSPFVDDAASLESSGIAGPMDEGMPMEEPMMDESMMEESAGMEAEPEPVMASAFIGGSINSQPPGYYALQVVASSSMENLRAFSTRHQISDQWVAETSVNGKTWFVLLQGIYPTMNEAKDALMQVSPNIETIPWIRSVGSLQAVMMQ